MTVISTTTNAESSRSIWLQSSTPHPSRSGASGRTRASSSAGGDLPAGPRPSPATSSRSAAQSRYYMTSPEGEKHFGWWRIDVIDDQRHLEFANGFAGDDGEPVPDLAPAGGIVELESDGGRTRMLVRTQFIDVEQMERMLGMGMQEGMGMALGQIDALLQRSGRGLMRCGRRSADRRPLTARPGPPLARHASCRLRRTEPSRRRCLTASRA